MSVFSNLASIAGISMGLSSIPQIYKIYLRKSAADISIVTHVIIVLGAFIWMLYGFEIKSIPIIISNFKIKVQLKSLLSSNKQLTLLNLKHFKSSD